jgi:pimeloyl-ACP methyl ester carboxylesterase
MQKASASLLKKTPSLGPFLLNCCARRFNRFIRHGLEGCKRNLKRYALVAAVVAAGGCVEAQPPAEADYGKTPVFFIHGHGSSSSCWGDLKQHLIRSGYPREYLSAINLEPSNGANIPAAERQIAPAVEAFLARINNLKSAASSPKSRIDLVSHSMGAVSARWYAAKLRPDRVRVWVSLAGANHGSNALCSLKDPGAEDLCPAFAASASDSAVQAALNGRSVADGVDETPYGIGKDAPGVRSVPADDQRRILYYTIRVEPDKWIKPEKSAVLDGAGGAALTDTSKHQAAETSAGNFLMRSCRGHDELLSCPDAMRLVDTLLTIGVPAK